MAAGCGSGGSHGAARRPNATQPALATVAANLTPQTPAAPSPTPSPSPTPTPSPTPAGITVQMANNVFIPKTITVPPGTTVTWINDEDPNALDNIHDVMADDYTSWSSTYMNPGESYSHTFAAPGTYHYLCDLHSRMEGTVIVQ